MKLTKLFYLFILTGFFIGIISCEKEDVNKVTTGDGMAIRTAEATANFDLSARKNWKMYIGNIDGENKEYNYKIEGHKLIVTSPTKSPHRFPYGATQGDAILQLLPEDYGKTRNRERPPFNLEDQSTPEKFMKSDRLRFEYHGKVKEDLSGLKILHFNALLDFRINNLPENAKVYIGQIHKQTIVPLQDITDPTNYKAIIFPNNINFDLIIEAEEKTYSIRLPQSKTRDDLIISTGIGNSSLITFNAEIDENDELKVSDLQLKKKAEWPIIE